MQSLSFVLEIPELCSPSLLLSPVCLELAVSLLPEVLEHSAVTVHERLCGRLESLPQAGLCTGLIF